MYGGGDYQKDYMYVDDVWNMDELMVNGDKNEIYNIGTGVSRSFREIIEYCKDKVGSTVRLLTYLSLTIRTIYRSRTSQ